MTHKKCSKCSVVRPLHEYHRRKPNRRTIDGFDTQCKFCVNEYRRVYRLKRRGAWVKDRPAPPAKPAVIHNTNAAGINRLIELEHELDKLAAYDAAIQVLKRFDPAVGAGSILEVQPVKTATAITYTVTVPSTDLIVVAGKRDVVVHGVSRITKLKRHESAAIRDLLEIYDVGRDSMEIRRPDEADGYDVVHQRIYQAQH